MISKHPSLLRTCPFSFSDRELLWLTAATLFGFHSSQRTAAAPTHIQMLRWSVASSDFLHAVVLAPCETQFLMFHVFQGVEDVGLPEIQAAAPSHDHLLHWDHAVSRLTRQPAQVLGAFRL